VIAACSTGSLSTLSLLLWALDSHLFLLSAPFPERMHRTDLVLFDSVFLAPEESCSR